MNRIYFLLILIILIASFLRVFKIDSAPPSLTWDEAAVGYNAFTIANYGKDEYGKSFPLYFRSFGEDKQPIHTYVTALFVKLFGLSEVTTRLPAAIFGVLNIILIFFLAKHLFKNEYIALLASFFLTISPQNVHFSRFNHEANFALFFFMLGLLLFFKFLKRENYLLPISVLSFFFSMISYHAAEVVIPPTLALLIILYFNQLKQHKKSLLITAILVISILIFSLNQQRLLGINRYNQTTLGKPDIEKTEIYKITHNYFFGGIDLVLSQYLSNFNLKYLFISGDENPRLASQGAGEFYIIDGLFLIIGVLYLIKNKSKENILLLGWILLGPLPSSLFTPSPHAGRAMFMMGSWHLVDAIGFYYLITFFKKAVLKKIIITACLVVLLLSLGTYFFNYLNIFSRRYAIDWQYGMKQMVEYAKGHDEFTNVIVTDVRAQPYIFFLYYLKTPLPDYINTVIYNNSLSKNSNNVVNFDRYYFGGELRESKPIRGRLYILTPSEYDGLRYKSSFDIKEIINYPNETVAFYIISAK